MREMHGLRYTTEYEIWRSMKKRCNNANHVAYHNYGGRGIKVCGRWMHSAATFFADMGPRPSKEHTLDRIDNDGNYEPGNCRWATKLEQTLNRRQMQEYRGVTLPKGKRRWKAQIASKYLGYFDSPEQAAQAYDFAAKKLYGDEALLNFPSYAV
jgi:hypothetical protein